VIVFFQGLQYMRVSQEDTHMQPSTAVSWQALTPQEAFKLLREVGAPWWVAGGWALDLHLGRVSRAHKDLDIGIFRRDAAIIFASLPGWEFFEAKDGILTQIHEDRAPRAEVNSLWCRPNSAGYWGFELMLDESDGEFWTFRRDRRISRVLTSAIRRDMEGLAYLAPEIQLLYKARATRAEDQADFLHVLPCLDCDARQWLRESLMRTGPAHPWTAALKVPN
jgi:Aminoglycoside-2''-adenylyltransferase